MQDFFIVLSEQIANERSEHGTHDAKSLLGMLYDMYTNFNGIEDYAIRNGFDDLYAAMNGKSLQEIDKIIDPVCTLCRNHQKTGFEDGVKVGMRTLKRKQDEFDQITGNMKEGLVLLDSMGRILSINPAARTLFGAGIACVGEDFLTIDRKQNMRLALEEAKTQGHADFRAKENGREYQFDLSRIDSDGNSHGMVILAFDVTEQVNAEKHRQEFTANVSHELKTPLQSIIGSAELMENGIVKAEDVPRFVGHIRKEAARLVFLIDDIIRLSELDEGAEMPREDVSLKALSEEVCETLADAAKLKDVSLEVTGDDGVIAV